METIIRRWLQQCYPPISNDWWWVKIFEHMFLEWIRGAKDLSINKKSLTKILRALGLPKRPTSLELNKKGKIETDAAAAMMQMACGADGKIPATLKPKELGKHFKSLSRIAGIEDSVVHAYPGQSWTLHALDAMARELLLRHRNETCFAVCWLPHGELICATNSQNTTITEKEIKEYLGSAAKSVNVEHEKEKASIDALSWVEGDSVKASREKYQKVFEYFLNNSKQITIVKNEAPGHAEVYLLDYLNSRGNQIPVLEIGVSMRCCAKCEGLFGLYQLCGQRKVTTVKWRGGHGIMDHGGWSLPSGLAECLRVGGQYDKALTLIGAESQRPETMELGQPKSNPGSPAGSPELGRKK